MKPGKLEKISDGKYFVKNNCTYIRSDEKGSTKLCNFYISDLAENFCMGQPYSYSLTLVSEDDEDMDITVPCYYLMDPYMSIKLHSYYDEYKITVSKKLFNECMQEIFVFICAAGKSSENNSMPGWAEHFESIGDEDDFSFAEKKYYSFNKYENPFSAIIGTDVEKPSNKISEILDVLNNGMSIPLFSFTLLSLLNEFQLPAENRKPDIILAITGGTLEARRTTALFFTNLYKRDPAFTDIEYKFFHVTQNDRGADIKLKAMQAKDCPLIAFEPDKRQLNFILKKVYHTNNVTVIKDSEIPADHYPVRSLCVFTRESIEDIKADNIIEICLNNFPDDYKKYKNCSCLNDDYVDEISECIYYYIAKLASRLSLESVTYVKDKFDTFCDEFKNLHPETDFSEKAYESTMLLLFAFKLFMEEYDDCEISEDLYQKAFDSISRVAEDSFPLGGVPTYTNFDNAKRACREIDAYFSHARMKKRIALLGQDKKIEDIWLWYDNDYFYLTADNIKDILASQGSKLKLSTLERKILHQKELIKVHIKGDGSIEYTVHYQKPLYRKEKTKKRFVAFNRAKCIEYNLFENLENYCATNEEPTLQETETNDDTIQ